MRYSGVLLYLWLYTEVVILPDRVPSSFSPTFRVILYFLPFYFALFFSSVFFSIFFSDQIFLPSAPLPLASTSSFYCVLFFFQIVFFLFHFIYLFLAYKICASRKLEIDREEKKRTLTKYLEMKILSRTRLG